MAEPMAVIATVSNAVALVKKAKAVADSMTNVELKMTIAELMGELATVKMQVAELQEENSQLRKRQELQHKLVYKYSKYFLPDPPEGLHVGPYCARCWDFDKKLISLIDYSSKDYLTPNFGCRVCGSTYDPEVLE